MAESQPTTAWTFKTLYDRVVLRLGVTSVQAKQYVNDGYQHFIESNDWTFLYEPYSVSVAASDDEIDLPLNFGSLSGTISTSDGITLNETSPATISMFRATSDYTGILNYYALAPSYSTAGQKWTMRFYPLPQSATTIYFQYRKLATLLSADGDYPLGGAMHSLTILQAAYMVWEQEKNQNNGLEYQKFQQMLERSIERDNNFRSVTLPPINTEIYTDFWSGVVQ
jgi:hypothetical protein